MLPLTKLIVACKPPSFWVRQQNAVEDHNRKFIVDLSNYDAIVPSDPNVLVTNAHKANLIVDLTKLSQPAS